MSKAAKIFVLFIIVLIAVFAMWVSFKEKDNSLNFKYISPKYMDVKNIRLVSGTLEPQKEVTLKSKISGIVEELYVKAGQKVEKGDAIARIKLLADPRNVEIAENQLKVAELNFNVSETKYIRNHWRPKQIDKGIISPQTS